MPYYEPRLDIGGDPFQPFYNLDSGVGLYFLNQFFDVKLVQFFLRAVFDHPFGMIGAPTSTLLIDGKCGPITNSYILAFQKSSTKLGRKLTLDGRVNPSPTEFPRYEVYTLFGLEKTFYDLYPYADPATAPGTPSDLRAHLMRTAPIVTKGGGV